MRFDRFSRRLFLTGAGGTVLALPWLSSLLPRSIRREVGAQPASIPKRFVAIKTYSGAPVLDWYPRQAPPGYSTHGVDGTVVASQRLAEPTGRHRNGNQYYGHSAPLSDFAATGVSNVFTERLNPHLDQMILFRGLDFMPGINHNHGGYLGNLGLNTDGLGGAVSGAQINATIDYVMSRSPNVYPSAPAGPRVFHLGSRPNTASYAPRDLNNVLAVGLGSIERAQAYVDPRAAFDAALSLVMPGQMAGGEPGVSTRLIDRVIDDYRAAMGGPHLSAADRMTLDRHVTHLVELEDRVNGAAARACDASSRPQAIDSGREFSVDPATITSLFDNFVDLIALAFSCDVTRIVTLDVTKMVVEDGGNTFGLGDSEDATSSGRSNWHFQAHEWDANAQRWLGQGARWVAERVVLRLLDRLAEITETDGESLLHHSLVMWSNELSFNHLAYSIPTATWGSAGGFLRTGRFIDYIDHQQPIRFRQHEGSAIEGVQFNRWLVTIMRAMGLSPQEYERERGRGFGEYGTVGKDDGHAKDYDQSNVGQVLPDIMV